MGIGKERERNINVKEKHGLAASCTRPDPGLNFQPRHAQLRNQPEPFALGDDAQPTEPHWSGPYS